MIKMDFTPEGEITLKFPEDASKKCFKKYGEIMAREGGIDPLAGVMLGIAAMNGTKTFERAAQFFNVA